MSCLSHTSSISGFHLPSKYLHWVGVRPDQRSYVSSLSHFSIAHAVFSFATWRLPAISTKPASQIPFSTYYLEFSKILPIPGDFLVFTFFLLLLIFKKKKGGGNGEVPGAYIKFEQNVNCNRPERFWQWLLVSIHEMLLSPFSLLLSLLSPSCLVICFVSSMAFRTALLPLKFAASFVTTCHKTAWHFEEEIRVL